MLELCMAFFILFIATMLLWGTHQRRKTSILERLWMPVEDEIALENQRNLAADAQDAGRVRREAEFRAYRRNHSNGPEWVARVHWEQERRMGSGNGRISEDEE